MAVDPESASPKRSLAAIASDGSFSLSVEAGRPYVLVFIDDSAVGTDMVVAIFRAQTLDTIAPADNATSADLGDVQVDAASQTASAGVSYDALLEQLGLSADAALFLGAIDDLSLRYANPDIDGDGVLDIEQDHHFSLDFHVRANMRRGATGANLTVADITDKFFDDAGDAIATPVFNLTSIYALYPASFDATAYVQMNGQTPTLQNGAAYAVTQADGSTPSANTSFSALGFGDTSGWGADYDYGHAPSLELPGSGGSPATIVYTLGATGTRLTFSNVVTRTRASLTDSGSLCVFTKLNTAGGQVQSIDYRWMKRVSATSWVPATAEEIAVTIGSDGGYVSVHRLPSWSNESGVKIPAQPSGTVAWTGGAMSPNDICGMAVSYDDKLGLRHFEGGVDPNPGVSCSFN
jgi:hypothetical protein